MLIICDHRNACPEKGCVWQRPKLNGGEILDASCDTVQQLVSIHEVGHELTKDDPNWLFTKKKYGIA